MGGKAPFMLVMDQMEDDVMLVFMDIDEVKVVGWLNIVNTFSDVDYGRGLESC